MLREIIKDPNMLLTLTWCHCTPADIPARFSIIVISNEHQLDNVACAYYIDWKGEAHILVSDHNAAIRGGATALLHQGCPIPIRDCQLVVATGGMEFNVKCSEL